MPKPLSNEEAVALGMKFVHNQMDNGEIRFRSMNNDGSGYIRTEMPESTPGEWQNAHYHGGYLLGPGENPDRKRDGTVETIIVQKGWIATADLLPNGDRELRIRTAGDIWTSRPGVVHNIYMPSGAVTHCVKHGKDVVNAAKGSDWYESPPAFDRWTKSLSEADIKRLATPAKAA